MRTAARSGGAAALLLVVFAAAWTAGAAHRAGPPGPTSADPVGAGAASPGPASPGPASPGPASPGAVPPQQPAGDAPADGVTLVPPTLVPPTLVPLTTRLDPGRRGEYAFRIDGVGALAAPPRLTVVRRDATGLVRATPTPGPDGVWRARVRPAAAGGHRAIVEVTPADGPPRVLTADLAVPGRFDPVPSRPARVAEVGGYRVRLDGDLVAGTAAQVFATVGRRGRPVTDLQPLEGGFGRLAALRVGDLAPARVDPDATAPAPTDRAGPGVAFRVAVPAAGTYRLFLDFRHDDALRTAVFTITTA